MVRIAGIIIGAIEFIPILVQNRLTGFAPIRLGEKESIRLLEQFIKDSHFADTEIDIWRADDGPRGIWKQQPTKTRLSER